MDTTNNNQPRLYVSIGPSGAGKSTASKIVAKYTPDLEVFSFDILRLKWYAPDNYSEAWLLSTKDKDFSKKGNQEFCRLLSTSHSIFVDNTNLTPKRRKFYITEAKRFDYETVAITFPDITLQILLERQASREDKVVPPAAVTQQYNSLVPPKDKEFDIIIPCKNLESYIQKG